VLTEHTGVAVRPCLSLTTSLCRYSDLWPHLCTSWQR